MFALKDSGNLNTCRSHHKVHREIDTILTSIITIHYSQIFFVVTKKERKCNQYATFLRLLRFVMTKLACVNMNLVLLQLTTLDVSLDLIIVFCIMPYLYTAKEYVNMHFICGECRSNASAAARLYRERYPNAERHPDHRVFVSLYIAYSQGRFPNARTSGGRPRKNVRRCLTSKK